VVGRDGSRTPCATFSRRCAPYAIRAPFRPTCCERPGSGRSVVADQNAMSATILEMMGSLDVILEAITGYKAKAVEAGFSIPAAEEMAVDLHQRLLNAVFAGIKH
jgi:hypothetical protein